MTKKEIEELTWKQLRIQAPSPIPPAFLQKSPDPVESYQRETAAMLIRAWNGYWAKEETMDDFLLVLRDFLNVFDTAWPSALLELPEENPFGIFRGEDRNYYATRSEAGIHIPVRFLEDIYHGKRSKVWKYNSKECLDTDAYIENLTGYKSFRSEEQKLAVYGALRAPGGSTTLITLPTGGGKSLITQTLAFQKPGLTIIVMPTVSLTLDQKRSSLEKIHRPDLDELIQSYTGGDDDSIALRLIEEKKLRMLFISPETLMKNPRFKEALYRNASWIQNIVIDEAHLAVEWGDSFRPDFQCLQGWRKELLLRNPEIRTVLMSATLNKKAVDILRNLFSGDNCWIEIRSDALRREPRIATVLNRTVNERNTLFLRLVRTLPHPMIVYVNSPEEAEEIKQMLNHEHLRNFRLYTGATRNKDRARIIDLWTKGELPLMIATNAFGVGVDKANIRTVLHLNLPTSVDAYYQELGRAGRDGLACLSVMDLVERTSASRASAFDEAAGKTSIRVMTSEKIIDRWEQMFIRNARRMPGTNSYLVSTAVQPGYQDEKDETGRVSQKNIQWNLYVLLLFKRHGLIGIQSIELNRDDYQFQITIEDERLREADDRLKELIERIREEEMTASRTELQQLWKMVKEASQGKGCWSELFTECYRLTDAYCAGCPGHIEPEGDESPSELKKKVDAPLLELSKPMQNLLGSKEEFLILSKEQNVLQPLQQLGMSLLITNDYSAEKIRSCFSDQIPCQVIRFEELRKLIKHGYFVSGLVGVLYSQNEKTAQKEFRRIRDDVNSVFGKNKKICLAHMFCEDFYFDSFRKNVTELIHGPSVTYQELQVLQLDQEGQN